MLPASSSGDGFYALNAFHLRAGQQPHQLFPDAVYTYGALESLRQVDDDVRQNLCTPSQVRVFAIWTEPLPAVAVRDRGGTDEGGDHHDDNGGAHNDRGDPPADAAEESETAGDSAETDMGHGSVVPHPDRASVESAIPRVQVPAPQRRELHEGLSQVLARAAEVHMLAGLTADQALTAARTEAWSFIRDMAPIELQRAKRQKFVQHASKGKGQPGASSSWY